MQNAATWFELPVTDLDRAQRFYETVLGRSMHRGQDFDGTPIAVFAYDRPGSGGCLHTGARTSATPANGIRIYLDCTPSIEAALARVEAAGGQIVVPKTALEAGVGFFARLRDTEGNEVGLHAAS